jgi:uncharacterized lipoprotein YddW (UPF0748 family)
LDWPSTGFGAEGQKAQLRNMLDKLRDSNFNTVFFQVRIRGDVFYLSGIEPVNPFSARGFDPLGLAIEECHRRGLECHAWFVTYPVGTKKQVAAHGRNSVVKKHPDLCQFYNGEWYLDPGNPGTRSYILSLINELVRNYDIDGIHLDYIRYPEKAVHFPDNNTYRKYGRGENLADWRRSNINLLVGEIYDFVKKLKPWVQVSSSPVGKYRNLDYDKGSWTAYESVYQDAAYWMRSGKHDALYPMLYYKGSDFYPFLSDWLKNSGNRLVIPGLGAYQLLPQEKDWVLEDITQQIDYTRKKGVKGQAYFRAGIITSDTKGINEAIKRHYYQHPAKLPSMQWLDNVAPNSPINLEAFVNEQGKLCLSWQPADKSEEQSYTVYRANEEDVDVNNPENILATGIRGNQVVLDMAYGEFGLYYSVTASDRFHNESVPCFPAFVVHSFRYKESWY